MIDGPTQQPDLTNGKPPSKGFDEFVERHHRTFQTLIWTVVAISAIGGTLAWAVGWLDVQNAGYWGAFVVNLVGSAAVVVPVPGLFAVCAASAPELELNWALLAVVGAAGSTFGELTGYLAGYGSQGVVQKSRYYSRIQTYVVKRGGFALFILAVVPNPLFDIGGITAGSMGYPINRFLLWVGFGKLIKFVITASGCHQGISWVSDLV